MKKIIFILSLFVFVSLNAQVRPGVIASQVKIVAGACGSGTSNYGDTDGTTAYGTGTADYIYYMPVDVVGCGTITSIKVFISGALSIKAGIYSGASTPTTLITNGTAGTITTTTDIYNTWTFSVNPSVTSSTKYWIGLLLSTNCGLMNSGGSVGCYYQSQSYASGLPATTSNLQDFASRDINAYIIVQH